MFDSEVVKKKYFYFECAAEYMFFLSLLTKIADKLLCYLFTFNFRIMKRMLFLFGIALNIDGRSDVCFIE